MSIRFTLTMALALLGAASAAQAQTTLTCTPDATCYNTIGATVTVTLDLAPDATTPATIVGGQFFLTYNSTNLTFMNATPVAPWTEQIFIDSSVPGQLSYAVGLPAGGGGTGATSGPMVTLIFTTTAEVCSTAALVAFDPVHSPPTRLVDVSDATYDQGSNLTAVDLTAITIDGTPPIVTPSFLPIMNLTCVADVPLPAAAMGSTIDGTLFATIAMGTVSDNCTTNANLSVVYTDSTPVGDACLGTFQIQRIITITDQCGNTVGPLTQVIIVNENVNPVVTAPTAIGVQCLADVPAAVTTQAAFVGIGGTATDNCTVDSTLAVTSMDGALIGGACGGTITRTYTITDDCLNSTNIDQIITVSDTTNPVVTAPTATGVQCFADVPAAVTTQAAFVLLGGTATDNCTIDSTLVVTSTDGALIGGACGGTITRTYTITDDCNNATNIDQIITVSDTTNPVVTAPTATSVQCSAGVPAAVTTQAAFVGIGGTATDNCTVDSTLTVTSMDGALIGGACGGTITRTYTITDDCNNPTNIDQIITVSDTMNPVVTAPTAITVTCLADVPAAVTTQAAFLAIGGTATDNCTVDSTLVVASMDGVLVGNACNGTITRTYTITDDCNNPASIDQIITVQDNTAPVFTTFPADMPLLQCNSDVPAPDTALVAANDTCSGAATIAFVSDVSSGTTCPEVITRTYSATDACGNVATMMQIFTVNDTMAPTATGSLPDGTGTCPSDTPLAETNVAGLVTLGMSQVPPLAFSDNCDPTGTGLTIMSVVDGGVTGLCTDMGGATFVRTYTIADPCGNTVQVMQNFNVSDTTPPSATAPADLTTLQCAADAPTPTPSPITFFEFNTTLGGTASDACTTDPNLLTITWSDSAPLTACSQTITRTFTITDECGNATPVTQTITVADTTPPIVTLDVTLGGQLPDIMSECSDLPFLLTNHPPATDVASLEALAAAGLITVTDNCMGAITVTSQDVPVTPAPANLCSGLIAVVRTYTISDGCPGSANTTVTQDIRVNDTTAPVINSGNPLPDITFTADAGGTTCQSSQTLTPPSVTDNCLGTPTLVATLPDGTVLPEPFAFPGGTTVITWTATDACGNIITATQNIIVSGQTQLDVTVELAGGYSTGSAMPSTLTRCITFVLHDCNTIPTPTPVTIEAEITFDIVTGSSTIGTGTLFVPCGTYSCITARDRLHTLRRTDVDNFGTTPIPGAPGTPFVADFTDKTATGGDNDALVGGNFNDDGFIDIIDFGIYVNRQGSAQLLDTTCATASPHLNITEPALPLTPTGIADTEDYTFITTNFLQVREANCCGLGNSIGSGLAQGDGLSPRMRISVAELAQLGLADLASSDLNQDGMLDAQDIAAFMLGERPAAQAQQPQSSGEKNRTPGGFQDGSSGGSNDDAITGGPRQATR